MLCAVSALSVISTFANRGPVALGWKFTVIVHVAPGASDDVHVLFLVKSPGFVPITLMLLKFRFEVPMFFSVMLCAVPVEPTGTDPKLAHGADNVTGYAGSGCPSNP
jgi:hypothetical protein